MISGPPTLVNFSDGPKKGLVGTIDKEDLKKSETIVLFINEENLSKTPHIDMSLINNMKSRAILDSGSEVNLLAQSTYGKLIDSGADIRTLPLENVILVTAFGKRSNRVKKQAMIEFITGRDLLEVNFFISPRLVNDAILGCQFMKEDGISINFERESFTCFNGENVAEHFFFYQPTGASEVGYSDRCSEETYTPTHSYLGQHPTI
jgi:hypothetical protein